MIKESENLRYCFNIVLKYARNCQDYYCWGQGAELLYECTVLGNGALHCAFCDNCGNGATDLLYCQLCHGATSCFGCISMKRRSYSILNKRYTKEEYERLVPAIIGHMKKTGEWGQYFPMQLSPHPYNVSLAQRYFPLTSNEASRRGLNWWLEDSERFGGEPSMPPSSRTNCPALTSRSSCEARSRIRRLGLPPKRLNPTEDLTSPCHDLLTWRGWSRGLGIWGSSNFTIICARRPDKGLRRSTMEARGSSRRKLSKRSLGKPNPRLYASSSQVYRGGFRDSAP